jgi:hypothetical protein
MKKSDKIAERTSQRSAEARSLFESALRAKGVTVVETDGDYEIARGGGVMTVNIENVCREYVRQGDAAIFDSFVAQLLSGAGSVEEPTWDELTHRVYWTLESRSIDIGEAIAATVSRDVRRVLVWTDPEERQYTFITPTMLANWGIDADTASARADLNQRALLDGKTVEINTVDGATIGMIPVATSLKASAILAANLREFIGDAIAWPVYAVVPCRDFALIFSQQDEHLVEQVGAVVVREFNDSGYPISTEVFAIGDNGIRAIGRLQAK